MPPLVSIILPTFNVARFLLQCLDSIESQTYKRIEVIIVVDGATDGSYEIAKQYAESHNRFFVYWQENQGSGPARNNGLEHANGDLILFIDPDDWCESNYVERMVYEQMRSNFDLVISADKTGYYNDSGRLIRMDVENWTEVVIDNVVTARESYLQLLEDHRIGSPHGKLYKMSIIKANEVRFPHLRRSQDLVFNYRYFSYINNYLITSYSGYVYRIIYSERMTRLKPDYAHTIIYLFKGIKEKHRQWEIPFNEAKASNYFFNLLCCMLEANIFNSDQIKDLLSDETIEHIVVFSIPDRIDRIIERNLLKNHCCLLSSLLFRFLRCLKVNLHRVLG